MKDNLVLCSPQWETCGPKWDFCALNRVSGNKIKDHVIVFMYYKMQFGRKIPKNN